jgi:mono/diheme cytochrome c family protein
MKRFTFLTAGMAALLVAGFSSCFHDNRKPGKIYMPDMTYSRAVETYAPLDSSVFTTETSKRGEEIFYNHKPVDGTIKMGDMPFFEAPLADSTGGLYAVSNQTKNPLPVLSTADSAEASRLFNINCAICHGAKAENNGPLSTKVGGIKSIVAASPGYSDGRIFHVMQYGQGNMGSYASQLSSKQRWMIIHYIRSLQPKPETATAAAATTAAPAAKPDSASTKKGI